MTRSPSCVSTSLAIAAAIRCPAGMVILGSRDPRPDSSRISRPSRLTISKRQFSDICVIACLLSAVEQPLFAESSEKFLDVSRYDSLGDAEFAADSAYDGRHGLSLLHLFPASDYH